MQEIRLAVSVVVEAMRLTPDSLLVVILLLIVSPAALPFSAFTLEHEGVSYDIVQLEKGEEQQLGFYWKRPDTLQALWSHPWGPNLVLAAILLFLVLTCVSFALFGFIIGLWANNFEKLQLIPMLVITPLVFLGGSFYSVDMLPPAWQTVSLFNPVLYLISGFRWSFYENADVTVELSLGMTLAFLLLCLLAVWWIFRTGYRLRS